MILLDTNYLIGALVRGSAEAERVIVLMGSGAEAAHEAVEHLAARGERVGALKVRLYRPFSVRHFLDALPASIDSKRRPPSSSVP